MLQELFKQITGNSGASGRNATDTLKGLGDGIGKAAGNIPGGLVGGAAAGGLMALLMSSKSSRKFVRKAAGYGGAAVLGGLAYNAYRSWKENTQADPTSAAQQDSRVSGSVEGAPQETIPPPGTQQPIGELTLLKAMIAAAKADGHMDRVEQQRIFNAVEQMSLPSETRGAVFDLLNREISLEELGAEAANMEQKSEIYLASCLVIDIDNPDERRHLDTLAQVFSLPDGLTQQLENQARLAIEESR
ncbi:MAG: tellurite resistance TerB family protein [Gammaproteobacteria bacterium]|jgi:uncharacterized membrane protein YebE (DUF533 family)